MESQKMLASESITKERHRHKDVACDSNGELEAHNLIVYSQTGELIREATV